MIRFFALNDCAVIADLRVVLRLNGQAGLAKAAPDNKWATEDEAWKEFRFKRHLLRVYSKKPHPLIRGKIAGLCVGSPGA